MGNCIQAELNKQMDGNVRFHRLRYHLAKGFVSLGDTVLDLGSGSGYGSSLLSEIATKVIGIEKENAEVIHAREKHGNDKTDFRCENLEEIQLPEVNIAVAFEVFEHLYKPLEFFDKLSEKVNKYIIFSVPVGQKLIWVEEAGEYQEEHDSTHKSVFSNGQEIVDYFKTLGWLEFYHLQVGVTFICILYNPEFICN